MRQVILLGVLLAGTTIPAAAWDGIDVETGGQVEIEKGNLVRSGRSVEIYYHEKNEYRDVDIEDINHSGNSVDIEVYDWGSGEYRTFEFDD
jgi:hypothetical protein